MFRKNNLEIRRWTSSGSIWDKVVSLIGFENFQQRIKIGRMSDLTYLEKINMG
jgi:hypothetical protein